MQILSVPNKMRNSSSLLILCIHWKASPHSAVRVFITSISIQDRDKYSIKLLYEPKTKV